MGGNRYVLSSGDGIFINSQVIHRFTILCNKNVILCIEMLRYLLYNLIISFVKEFVNMAVNYRKTLISCYLGFITQAIAANFAPLLFLIFHNGYGIPFGKIALISSVFFVTQYRKSGENMENEIKKDRITTDETLRETASHGSEEYPFSYYYEDIWDFDFHCIDWHWHPEVEFVYVQHSKADFLVGGNRYVLSSGDGIFINSQVIHRFEAEDSAIIPNIVFSPVLLAPQGSLIYSRYIRPIIESTTECVIFSTEETAHHSIIETMRSVFAVQGSGTASEMETVELLLKLWRLLYESIQITDCGPVSGHSAQTQAKLQTCV